MRGYDILNFLIDEEHYRNRFIQIAIYMIVVILFIFLRRPDQFFRPYVWCEDGTYNLLHYAQDGWLSIFYPVQGYYILSSKLISLLSLQINFFYYPEITAFFSVLFMVFVGLTIALTKTQIRSRWLCALVIFLLPFNPETFGVGLYSFWWAGLLIVVAALWEGRAILLRSCLLVLGGLSSPIITIAVPVFVFRLFLEKTTQALIVTLISVFCALIQFSSILGKQSSSMIEYIFSALSNVDAIVIKFFGYFIHQKGNFEVSLAAGIIILSIFIWLLWVSRRDYIALYLAYFTLATIMLSIVRVDVSIIHPEKAGPRYFFYPYIFLMWSFIHMAYKQDKKRLLFVLFGLVIINSSFIWSRTHDSLNWRSEVLECVKSESYSFPIHYAGDIDKLWKVKLTREQCLQLIDNSFLIIPQAVGFGDHNTSQ